MTQETPVLLDHFEIGLIHTLIVNHVTKLKKRKGEGDNDFAFRVEAYAKLARKLNAAYEGLNND